MDTKKFEEEIKEYSLEELKLIYDTQEDLYTEEEMSIISNKIQSMEQEKIGKLLPKEIKCPKCYVPNPFENDKCMFCDYELDKNKYYDLDYYENSNNADEDATEDSYLFQYVISFLIPLIGFILGAILLSKEDKEKVSKGKSCIMIGIASIVIYIVVCSILIFS